MTSKDPIYERKKSIYPFFPPISPLYYTTLFYPPILTNFIILLFYPFTTISPLIKPAQSAGFSRIKKIPYQAPPTHWGPENVHFRKRHFWDPNINVGIFIFFRKFKELPGYLKRPKKRSKVLKNAEK